MSNNSLTAIQMAKQNENENAENRKEIQQVVNDATMLARKVGQLRYNYDGNDEDRRCEAISKAAQAIEQAIEELGNLYGYEVISRAMNVIELDEDITDDEAADILTGNNTTEK